MVDAFGRKRNWAGGRLSISPLPPRKPPQSSKRKGHWSMHTKPADILVVEDNLDDLELTLNALARQDWAGHTAVARDGEEALDFIFARGVFSGRTFAAPRLVLLDLKLPKVDGIEVLKQLKDDFRTRSIPVVIFTSSK